MLALLGQLDDDSGLMPAVIIRTGQGSERVAVDALKRGSDDYLVKNHITTSTLRLAVHSTIEKVSLTTQLRERKPIYGGSHVPTS